MEERFIRSVMVKVGYNDYSLLDVARKLSITYGLPFNLCERFVNKFHDNIVVSSNSIGIFLMLEDVTFDRLKLGEFNINKFKDIVPLLKERGNNYHFCTYVGRGVMDKLVLRHLWNWKSVSWFTPSMNRLVCIERSLNG